MQIEETPVQIISTLSQDIIHDISFDWYGRRIATCSSDKTIKIYQRVDGKWKQQNTIKVLGGPLWRVKWARPQLGQIIATCSLDRNVKIYEKRKNQWIEQYKITDSKDGIEDIKFSPNLTSGLLLATASSDGNIRIYEALDPMSLKNWNFKYNIPVNELGLNCLSWNKSLLEKMSIAVGCKDIKTTYKRTVLQMINEEKVKAKINTTASTVCIIYFKDPQWIKLELPFFQSASINDISFALPNGRSSHLLAYCTNTFVKICYIRITESEKSVFLEHSVMLACPGSRLSWNVMATHLAISSAKSIRIYKASGGKSWNEVKRIQESNQ